MFFRDKLKLTKLPVSRILPNPSQPRKVFRQEELEALAQSIKENGLLQPVTVRRENGAVKGTVGKRAVRLAYCGGTRFLAMDEAESQRQRARLEFFIREGRAWACLFYTSRCV